MPNNQLTDFPSEITKNSRKEDIWEELKYAHNEIEQQRRDLNTALNRVTKLEAEINSLCYKLDIIRAVMDGAVPRQ